MKFLITFFDKTEITVEEKDGIKIMKAKADGVVNVLYENNLYTTSSIAKIEEIKERIDCFPQLGQPCEYKDRTKYLVSKEILEKVRKHVKNMRLPKIK